MKQGSLLINKIDQILAFGKIPGTRAAFLFQEIPGIA
jgi:hypothetical protein